MSSPRTSAHPQTAHKSNFIVEMNRATSTQVQQTVSHVNQLSSLLLSIKYQLKSSQILLRHLKDVSLLVMTGSPVSRHRSRMSSKVPASVPKPESFVALSKSGHLTFDSHLTSVSPSMPIGIDLTHESSLCHRHVYFPRPLSQPHSISPPPWSLPVGSGVVADSGVDGSGMIFHFLCHASGLIQ